MEKLTASAPTEERRCPAVQGLTTVTAPCPVGPLDRPAPGRNPGSTLYCCGPMGDPQLGYGGVGRRPGTGEAKGEQGASPPPPAAA